MAAASPADQGAVINGSPPCKLVPCGDGRHFTFRVDYEAVKQSAASQKLRASCPIGDVYECEATLKLHEHKRNHIGFIVKVSGPLYRDVQKVLVDLVLLDNTRLVAMRPPIRSVSSPAADGRCGLVVSKDYLEANCLNDGILVVLCSVLFVPDLPPCLWSDSLGHRLAAMSNKQDHTDVCFEVDGEKFNAHRLVMAAQSEVFRALLLGSMAESKMDTIPIHEISASTFKHMLHYIYCNQLPAADDDVDHVSRMTELQHLLVAADMYGVDTLKQLCEVTLCAGINKDTVTSTLALTEDGSYRKLRASCIEFLSKTQIFAVATTDEFCQVVQSYPDVLMEIRDRFQKPRLSPNLTPSKRPRLSAKLTPSTDTEEDQNQP